MNCEKAVFQDSQFKTAKKSLHAIWITRDILHDLDCSIMLGMQMHDGKCLHMYCLVAICVKRTRAMSKPRIRVDEIKEHTSSNLSRGQRCTDTFPNGPVVYTIKHFNCLLFTEEALC